MGDGGDRLTGEEEACLRWLEEANRPMNAAGVAEALKGKKGSVQRSLDALVEKGRAKSKDFKAVKVYFADQARVGGAAAAAAGGGAFEALKAEAAEASRRAAEAAAAVRDAQAQGKRRRMQATVPELREKRDALEARVRELKAKAGGMAAWDKAAPSATERQRTDKELKAALAAWKKRKTMCSEILDGMAEGTGKSLKQLHELLGTETDEQALAASAGASYAELVKLLATA